MQIVNCVGVLNFRKFITAQRLFCSILKCCFWILTGASSLNYQFRYFVYVADTLENTVSSHKNHHLLQVKLSHLQYPIHTLPVILILRVQRDAEPAFKRPFLKTFEPLFWEYEDYFKRSYITAVFQLLLIFFRVDLLQNSFCTSFKLD